MRCGRGVGGVMTLAPILLAALAMSACVPVAFPTTTRIEDKWRKEKKLPAAPIVPGRTTRAEVEDRYAAFTIETGIPDLYWARFRRSTWGGGVVGYPTGGGRAWSVANVLVSFGPDGTARRSVDAGEKQLLPDMIGMLAESAVPSAGGFEPVAIEGWSTELKGPDGRPRAFSDAVGVDLTERGVVVTRHPWGDMLDGGHWQRPPIVATVPFAQIARVQSVPGDPDSPESLTIKFSFKAKTAVGDHLTIDVSTNAIPPTARWLARFRPDLAGGAPLPTTLALAAGQVRAVTVGLENEVQPSMVRAALFFEPEPKTLGHLTFCTTPRSALVLLRWWAQAGRR